MTTPDFKRKLSAIFMADVVGYSRLMGENEAATLQTLTTYQGVVDGLIRQHRGRVVDAPGDAILAEFSSVVDAVQCAVAIQKELEARNAELPEDRRMQLRIGINLGDVIEEGDKIYGDGVNIAARLESLAEAGGICISRTAFDHIETKLPLGYEFLGEKSVKNIARPVGAYRVVLEPRITVAGHLDRGLPRPRRTRTAVAAAALVLGTAVISLAVWKSGFFAPPPAPPPASVSPPSSPSPPLEETPGPQVSPPPAASATPAAPASPSVSLRPAPPAPAAAPPARKTPPSPAPPAAVPPPQAAKPAAAPSAASPTRTASVTPPAPPAPAAAPPAPGIGPSSLLRMFDADHDGKVSLQEFMAWRENQFEQFDANRDGKLSREELRAGTNRFARILERNFDLIDTNRDQLLSREEFRQASRRRFLIMDTNRDGYLTQEELHAATDRQ